MSPGLRNALATLRKVFNGFWWAFVVFIGLAVVLSEVEEAEITANLKNMLLLLSMGVQAIMFFVYLGAISEVARQLGKSQLVYVGGTFAFSWLGVLVSYYSVQSLVRKEYRVESPSESPA